MDNNKVSSNRQKKIETVGQFEEKIKRSKALVLADYRGLTHQQLEGLKKALKQSESELVVTKNALLKRALEKVEKVGQVGKVAQESTSSTSSTLSTFDLTGPTATIFAYNDVIAPLKELAKTIKLLKLPIIKLAMLDGKMLDAEAVLRLAALPGREVLIAQLVGGMKSPIYGLHRALTWNLQKLVMTLKAIELKKLKKSNI